MNDKIAIIGLGYVGLPLAVAFAEKYKVIGFDINQERIDELNNGKDHTLEVEDELLKSVLSSVESPKGLFNTNKLDDLSGCNIYIVTVPTPIDDDHNPDLTPLLKASQTVGKVLKKGDIVIYESTVYPGATEEDCVPVLEEVSGLTFNKDFFCGYSPERINPGDKEHTVTKILKVTSGSTPEIAERVKTIYDFKCQVCGIRLDTPSKRPIAIGAHIKGLGFPHNGPDVIENMLCLCPNHHDQFDKYSFSIDPKDFRIIGLKGFENRKLKVDKRHKIDKLFLKYQQNDFLKENAL